MKWQGRRQSSNIEDRRGGGRVVKAGGGLGVGAILLFLASVFFPDAVPLLRLFGADGGGQQVATTTGGAGVNDDNKAFIGVVLADTEEVWGDIFQRGGAQYPKPTVVIFSGRTNSPCGPATTGSGPFYCPGDRKVYIDPAFYEVMSRQLGAKGDFAQAYVIAHEVAHHVQNVMGTIPEVDQYRRGASQIEANRATVRLELQADCYSGVWTNHAHARFASLERGDIQEALNAAAQIGDDTLQARSSGHVDPRKFTHGTSDQRVQWFFKGLQSGNISTCDTFSQPYDAL